MWCQDRYDVVLRYRSRWCEIRARWCEIGARCCEIGTRYCGNGTRWCEIARDAARSVRDGVRSVRVLCVGSRNLHRHTHHTRTAQANTQHTQRLQKERAHKAFTVGKKWPGLRPGQSPVCVVRGRGEAENSRTAGGERREEQTEMRLFRESVFYNKFIIKIKHVL